jgi:hypothetical protein
MVVPYLSDSVVIPQHVRGECPQLGGHHVREGSEHHYCFIVFPATVKISNNMGCVAEQGIQVSSRLS